MFCREQYNSMKKTCIPCPYNTYKSYYGTGNCYPYTVCRSGYKVSSPCTPVRNTRCRYQSKYSKKWGK